MIGQHTTRIRAEGCLQKAVSLQQFPVGPPNEVQIAASEFLGWAATITIARLEQRAPAELCFAQLALYV